MEKTTTQKICELISEALDKKDYELSGKLQSIYHDIATKEHNTIKRQYREHRKSMIRLYGNKELGDNTETITVVDMGRMTEKEYVLRYEGKINPETRDIDFYFSSGNGYHELKLLEDSLKEID